MAAGLLGAVVSLRVSEPQALRAMWAMITEEHAGPEAHRQALRDLAPLLARHHREGLPAEVSAAVERGDLDVVAQCRLDEPPDWLTFSGNGEPTLHPDFQRVGT